MISLWVLGLTVLVIRAGAQKTCDVGELEKVEGGGLCNGGHGAVNEQKCDDHCKNKYGVELLDAVCSNVRANGKRECICKLKCCNSGCWGDPHCWTCDGEKYDYQGLKKYYVMKPCKKYDTIPNFEIRQVNRPWAGGPAAVLKISEVVIPEWQQNIELTMPETQTGQYILKINGKVEQIPVRFSNLEDFKESSLSINFADAGKRQVVLVTSFGLRITYATINYGNTVYSDLSIDTPRHPELKGRICGLLGRWNDNINDELVDATGVLRPKDQFNWAFGNSWIVPDQGPPPSACELEQLEKELEEKTGKVDEENKKIIEKLCRDNLQHKQFEDCARDMNRPPPNVEDCVLDLLFIKDVNEQKSMIKAMLEKFSSSCNKEIKFKEPKCCLKNLTPLYRSYNPNNDDHFYTTNNVEPINAVRNLGYLYEGSHGLVASSPNGCGCESGEFKPIYRLYKAQGAKADHFYTINAEEANRAATQLGYTREGTSYYCATTKGQCGATLEWRRYFRGFDHFYTSSEEEGTKNVVNVGGTFEGIMCYIWPAPEAVKQ